MKDNCYIDDISTYRQYGVWVTKGGYNGLLTFPALVEPEKTDWQDEDGIEVDLTNPALQPRTVVITFLAEKQTNIAEFVTFLSQIGYRTVRIPRLGQEWTLRLSQQSNNIVYHNACNFSLLFVEDVFTRTEAYLPTNGIGIRVPRSPYSIDGHPLGDYGVAVKKGKGEFLKMPSIKQNLTQKFFGVDGQKYDAGAVFFSEKEVTFDCAFFAPDMDIFWLCYHTFFNMLTDKGERTLYCDYTEQEYPCYYKKSSDFKIISLAGRIIVDFKLTLVFTTFHIGETEYVLSSEDDEDICLEDGETLIDMK